MEYMSWEKKDAMLEEEFELERNMMHARHECIVGELERSNR